MGLPISLFLLRGSIYLFLFCFVFFAARTDSVALYPRGAPEKDFVATALCARFGVGDNDNGKEDRVPGNRAICAIAMDAELTVMRWPPRISLASLGAVAPPRYQGDRAGGVI